MNIRDISQRLRRDRGQALIEFILVLPMIFLLIVNLVNFGGFFYAWITVADAARAGADFGVLGGASVTGAGIPNASKIANVIKADIASLPNAATATIDVCQNGVAKAGSCTGLDSDPEPTNYVMTVIDVSYTYQPFIQVYSFPTLGVYLTIPPTTVYQRAELRTVQ